ncbi:hypothetical protein A4X09_0g5007 [Tilletia walkeri]|uniref:Uncharacterized protein n=1 Tax=Tilletia walkeri TaxID=117179 RepID=A0A8X7N7D3_9BASI|nr:hypothetical protein A4X09_0g5007 [Tilletia walkeri]
MPASANGTGVPVAAPAPAATSRLTPHSLQRLGLWHRYQQRQRVTANAAPSEAIQSELQQLKASPKGKGGDNDEDDDDDDEEEKEDI